MSRFLQKQYAKIQQSSSTVLRELYEETIYYMHQPQSLFLRFTLVTCLGLWFSSLAMDYQKYFGATYRRKKSRLLELKNMNNHA